MKLKKIYNRIKFISRTPADISKIVRGQSYYPEKERKSSPTIFLDNLLWIIKNKEVNYFYNSNGLDIKNWRSPDEFLPDMKFRRERESGNSCKNEKFNYNYIAMLRDKYVFASYLSYVIGEDKVVPTIALYNNEEVYLLSERTYISLEDFFQEDTKVFCKIINGEGSEEVFILEKKEGNYFLNSKKTTLSELKLKMKDSKYIFQDVIQQHESLNKINDSSVNTIRITTVRGASGKINILNSFLRLGSTKDSFVDNVKTGGLAVGIDDSGLLRKYGFYDVPFGTKVEKHPINNTVFEGYQLPYWDEVKDLVEKAHKQFYYVQSIGWDVAITPNGPILIEGNDNWGSIPSQIVEGGLKEKWYELKNA